MLYGVFANLESFSDRYFKRHKRETRFLYTHEMIFFLFFKFNFGCAERLQTTCLFLWLAKTFSHIALISSRLVVKHIPFEKSFDVCGERMKQKRGKERKKHEKEGGDGGDCGGEGKETFVVIYSRASERFLELNRAHS